jgi:prolyl-tRNA editing enzyme YbaK/EbsC (Cys-tRNA(Pro) deacylase)
MNDMSPAPLPPSAQKVADAATALGLSLPIRIMDQPTRTAQEAAEACGCDVAQIVKSLIFRGATTDTPYLLLVSGKNRVNETSVAAHLGEPLRRPDAADVRALTGYAIGGIPPLGHATELKTYMDEDLLPHAEIWAAAGTPNSIFPIAPGALRQATRAAIISVV